MTTVGEDAELTADKALGAVNPVYLAYVWSSSEVISSASIVLQEAHPGHAAGSVS